MKENDYVIGYDQVVVNHFNTRTAEKEAAFLLPYLKPNMSLIDCGCGPGSITKGLAKRVQSVVAMDITEHVIEGDNISFVRGDVCAIPFDEGTFDVAFTNGLLSNLQTPIKALEEIKRVVKPGGVIALREFDIIASLFLPQSAVLAKSRSLSEKAAVALGVDFAFGRKLKPLLHDMGFSKIAISGSFDIYDTQSELVSYFRVISKMWESSKWSHLIREKGWASEEEINEIQMALKEAMYDPRAFASSVWYQAIGYK